MFKGIRHVLIKIAFNWTDEEKNVGKHLDMINIKSNAHTANVTDELKENH
jgi:hypothetical protein